MKNTLVILLVAILLVSVIPINIVHADSTAKVGIADSITDTFNQLRNSDKVINAMKSIHDKTDLYFKMIITQFKDMSNHWGIVTMGKLVELEILTGYDSNMLKPNGNITRAEFSTMLRKSVKLDIQEGNSFNDTTSHWAKDEIHTLAENAIIKKTEHDDKYSPNTNITRLEMAKMIVRALGLEKDAIARANQKTPFSDDKDISNTDKGYVLLATEYKIINGYPDKSFKPNGQATRAEASAMLINMLNNIAKPPVAEKFIEPNIEIRIDTDPHSLNFVHVILKNSGSYDDSYSFQFECINYPELNKKDRWNGRKYITLDSSRWRTGSDMLHNPAFFILHAVGYTTRDLENSFKLTPNMELNFKITVKKDTITKYYYFNATIPEGKKYY